MGTGDVMQKTVFSAWNDHARTKYLMIAMLGVMPLAGCTSSGISDIASGLETSAIAPAPIGAPQQLRQNQIQVVDLPPPVATAPAGLEQMEQPVSLTTLIENSEPESFALASYGQDANGFPAQAYGEVPLDTPETLAEQRIAELFPKMKHGTCKTGWGTQAKRLDANRYTPGDPYYIEIRMRHTPPLPVGHTYTAYGRLDEQGNKLDEHLVMLAPVGGYVGAGIAGAIPMPGIMVPQKTDCKITPKAAYRVSLSAVQYEKLLLEIKQAKIDKPRYQLFTYNCNHFTSRISESVGIKTPRNKYTSSLVYMYDIIKENELRATRLASR